MHQCQMGVIEKHRGGIARACAPCESPRTYLLLFGCASRIIIIIVVVVVVVIIIQRVPRSERGVAAMRTR